DRVIVLDNQVVLSERWRLPSADNLWSDIGTPQVFDAATGVRLFLLPVNASHIAAAANGTMIAASQGPRIQVCSTPMVWNRPDGPTGPVSSDAAASGRPSAGAR